MCHSWERCVPFFFILSYFSYLKMAALKKYCHTCIYIWGVGGGGSFIRCFCIHVLGSAIGNLNYSYSNLMATHYTVIQLCVETGSTLSSWQRWAKLGSFKDREKGGPKCRTQTHRSKVNQVLLTSMRRWGCVGKVSWIRMVEARIWTLVRSMRVGWSANKPWGRKRGIKLSTATREAGFVGHSRKWAKGV